MPYKVIQPPFSLRFREMPVAELKAYNVWFQQIIPERIDELTRCVNGTSGYENWQPDTSPASLEILSRWFESEVRTRKRTAAEIEELRATQAFPFHISDEELTDRTFSVAIDIAAYFSQVILRNLVGTQWELPLRSKRFADYGQPVISGLGRVPLNPIRIAVSAAYGISRGGPARLREKYDFWSKPRN